ncbi:MAG TPA: amino acid adenylation domain-containing protein, partial [Ktedonobacteraceae bacterium]
FNEDTITGMMEQYQQLLQEIVRDPEQQIAALSLLTEREWQRTQEGNQTRVEYPATVRLHRLFEEQARRTPDTIALVLQRQHLTYQELEQRTNQLAHFLVDQGVGPESAVGIFLERSFEMVIAMLGILKAGGVYVPLEPSNPVERVAFLLAEADIQLLLTSELLDKQLSSSYTGQRLFLDQEWSKIAAYSSGQVADRTGLDSLAYIIYTSGSTGYPKGVMSTHRNVCNRLLWGQATYKLTSSDRVLQKTPYNFDVSVWEFFWPLTAGSCLVLLPPEEHRNSASLGRAMEEEQITTTHFIPSMLNVFLEHQDGSAYRHLKHVFCSGESLPSQTLERFSATMPGQLHNLYGPTETSIEVSFWEIDPSVWRPLVPIGRAISNSQLYVLDSQMRPLPGGVAGEIYIGGDGLARGYLHQPDLTAGVFLPNPFSSHPGERLYRSGDRGRYLPNGAIEFLGRTDHQIKIRGFRIELGEIEATLNRHPEVQVSVVLAREEKPGERYLAAYVVPQVDATPAISALRQHLRQCLPDYMVPAAFLLLDALPLTVNGKINRRALPAPANLRPELEPAFVPPRTPVEHVLVGIWTQLLPLDKVGVYDNFFDLGGHSLLATRILSRIRQALHVDLSLRVFFEGPTIADLATKLSDYEKKKGQVETIARLNQEVARMSTEEISRLLAQKKQAREY